MPTAEGRSYQFDDESSIDSSLLETFPFDLEVRNGKSEYIKIETDEFSAVCPFSGLPDFAKLTLIYYPDGKKCIELKSFKYYLYSYRNVGIYQEAANVRIYNDMVDCLETQRLKVILTYNTRGGIDTTTSLGDV